MIALIFVIFLRVAFTSSDQMLERAHKAGASIECHYVTTEDGYILRLYHIPPMPNATTGSNETKTIFFMHGLQSSSLDYVIYPNISLGFYFSSLGFSVWFGNARGNTFSRNHTTLDPDKSRFWSFSFHEIAIYDLPAQIDFILAQTNRTQLIYVGHSQGGNIIFILLSERPEYNKKIALVHAMAAAVFMVKSDSNALLNPLLDNLDDLKIFVEQIQFYEFNSFRRNSKFLQPLGELCTDPFVTKLCECILSHLFGSFAPGSYYKELLREYSSINPSGSSYMQYVHFGQLFVSGRFQKFDHGPNKNMKLYNSTKPPEYNLSNVQTKVHVMFGTNDNLVVPESIPKLLSKINKNVVAVDEVTDFNHLDFVMGRLVHKIQAIILRVINAHT
ncbi:lipase 3-like [Sitodiplosis mosellana]|uniref:lipase 3-like n=1 Tax=Sitodiplosis mosellana TaxID=263140 RepID=UPI002445147F|nr:lipase 3-like [Sitodiplosis mosellana]